MNDWFNRPLDRVCPVTFIDAIVVKVRHGQVRNKPMSVVIGVTTGGERDILGIWAGGGEGAKFWLSALPKVRNRGVADVCIAVCGGLKGLPEAINAVWELATVQQCIIHLNRNTFRYASKKNWGAIASDLTRSTPRHQKLRPDCGAMSSARSGEPRIRRSPSCGPPRGRSSCRSWATTSRPQDHLLDQCDTCTWRPDRWTPPAKAEHDER